MKKLFLLLVAVLTLSLCASAQTRTVQGVVIDAENDEPLIGASVQAAKGIGVSTDIDGHFSISVPAGTKVLTISYVGYETQEVSADKSDIVVRLQNANNLLDPVIVVAYGEQKKSSFTGSAATVGSATIEKTQVTNVLDALSGKVAGLQLANASGAPGASSPTIRIRGFSSIQAGNAPLIIVDGTPYTGDINSLNTNDIESMSVLKDAASNALYGARGANGVIIITTKRAKLGEATVTVDAKWGANSRATQDYNYITNPGQYYETYYGALNMYATMPVIDYTYPGNDQPTNLGGQGMSPEAGYAWTMANIFEASDSKNYGLGYNVYTVPEGQQVIGTNGKLNPNATLGRLVNYQGQQFWLQPDDWTKATYRTSLRQEYNVGISRGDEKSNFYAAINYLNNEGIVVSPSDFQRFTVRINADIQAKPWLKVGANASYAHINITSMDGDEGTSNSSSNIFAFTSQLAPIYPLYMRNGNKEIMKDSRGFTRYDYGYGLNGGGYRPFLNDSNPLSNELLNSDKSTANVFTGTGFVEIRFLKDFKFTSNNNVNILETRGHNMVNPYYGQYATQNGIITVGHSRNTDYTFQQLLNWNHMFNQRHNVSVLLGHEWYKTITESLQGNRHGMFNPHNYELAGAIFDDTSSSARSEYNNEGWFMRAQYDLDSKYFASASFRRDASSRFHPDHRWGSFWSLGGAWILSKEDFFQVDWVNMLKIKASYGEQGNDNIGNYRYTDTYGLMNSNGYPAAVPDTKGNPDITWEKNGNFNAGVEFELLNARLNGQIEGFYRTTHDMLMYFPTPYSYGYLGYYDNVGNMMNAGVEIELQGTPIRTKDFSWTINANLTWYKNKITMLPDERKGDSKLWIDDVPGFQSSGIYYGEGRPMYTYVMKKFAGVDPETGLSLYYKNVLDKDGYKTGEVVTTTSYSDASQYLVGTALAPVYGGFSTTFEYKGFDLSASFNYQIGGHVYDSGYAALMGSPNTGNRGVNIHADILKAWTPENNTSNIPRFMYGDEDTAAQCDRFWTDASYLSLENINFGYTLPTNIVKKMYLNKLRVYFAADNLWVWSKRQGLDPRTSFTGSPNNTNYASMRTLSGGLTVTF
ncbi:MAG: TonB-dependent receptor [Muribaculaceae bacterium]|nr:TonB-dependent receptor [Muribaculaceae bacterium]